MTNKGTDVYKALLHRAQTGDDFTIRAFCQASILAYQEGAAKLLEVVYHPDYHNILIWHPEPCKNALEMLKDSGRINKSGKMALALWQELIKLTEKVVDISGSNKSSMIKKTRELSEAIDSYVDFLEKNFIEKEENSEGDATTQDKIKNIDEWQDYYMVYKYMSDFLKRAKRNMIATFVEDVKFNQKNEDLLSFILLRSTIDVLTFIGGKKLEWAKEPSHRTELLLKVNAVETKLEREILRILIDEIWLLQKLSSVDEISLSKIDDRGAIDKTQIGRETRIDLSYPNSCKKFFIPWLASKKITEAEVNNLNLAPIYETIKTDILNTIKSSDTPAHTSESPEPSSGASTDTDESPEPKIIIITGPPASGKSTLITQIKEETRKLGSSPGWAIFDMGDYSLMRKTKDGLPAEDIANEIIEKIFNNIVELIIDDGISNIKKKDVFNPGRDAFIEFHNHLNQFWRNVSRINDDNLTSNKTPIDNSNSHDKNKRQIDNWTNDLNNWINDYLNHDNKNAKKEINSFLGDFAIRCQELVNLKNIITNIVKKKADEKEINSVIGKLMSDSKLKGRKLIFIFDEFELCKNSDKEESKIKNVLSDLYKFFIKPSRIHTKGIFWILSDYSSDSKIYKMNMFNNAKYRDLKSFFSVNRIQNDLLGDELLKKKQKRLNDSEKQNLAQRIWYWTRGHPAFTVFLVAAYTQTPDDITIDQIALSEKAQQGVAYVVKEKIFHQTNGTERIERRLAKEKALEMFSKSLGEVPPIIAAHVDAAFGENDE